MDIRAYKGFWTRQTAFHWRCHSPKKDFYLSTDASDVALGSILYQKSDDGDDRVFCFARRTLKGPELLYISTEKKLLAIVWFLRMFRSFLLGSKIIINTDHKPLPFLKSCKLLNAFLTRWILQIQDYDLKLCHSEGKKNLVADALSRNRVESPNLLNPDRNKVQIFKIAQDLSRALVKQLKFLALEQEKDEWITNLDISNDTKYLQNENVLYKKIGQE